MIAINLKNAITNITYDPPGVIKLTVSIEYAR